MPRVFRAGRSRRGPPSPSPETPDSPVPRSASLPFVLTRRKDVYTDTAMTTTKERVHGLLRLEGEHLRIQWRVGRTTERYGATEVRSDDEVEPVQEVVVPLEHVAGAVVRQRWWERWTGPRLVLTGRDLRAFEGMAGVDGLQLSHPAELTLRLRRGDGLAASEFAGELEMAVAERSFGGGSGDRALYGEGAPGPLPPPED
jgi:hypothetical protein